METKAGILSFGKRLLLPSAAAVREKLLYLADRYLDDDIHVDTLTGMHFDPGAEAQAAKTFLIFDFHRIFLYENCALPDRPRINSVIRSLIDDYPISPIQIMADHAQEFHFFYPLEVLEVLPLLWRHRRPGTLVTLDLSSSEIRTARAFVHPECELPHLQASTAQHSRNRKPLTAEGAENAEEHKGKKAANDASSANSRESIIGYRNATAQQNSSRVGTNLSVSNTEDSLPDCRDALSLKDCFTGPNLRGDSIPKLDDLVSPNVGMIRRETSFMGRLSFPMVMTQMAAGSSTTFSCGGRSTNMPAARRAARCEAIERFQVNFLDPEASLVYGSYQMLQDTAIDPETLCFSLLRDSPSRQWVRYDRGLPMYWTPACNLLSGKMQLVPAQEIWFNTPKLPDENLCLMSSTNACAVGGSVEEAALFALFEAIERDAFLTTWYLRRRCVQVLPGSIRLEAFQWLWHRLQSVYPNYSILLFDITTDVAIPVILCAAVKQSGRGPQVVLSTACRLHADEAAFAAMKDLSGMFDAEFYDEARARKLLDRPEDVTTPEDHAAYYSLPETFERLFFLGFHAQPERTTQEVDQSTWIERRNSYNLKTVLEEIMGRLDALGITVLLKDLTHREFRCRNLHCVRAIAAGLYPMWFGYYAIRFRMSDRLRRLSETFAGKPLEDVSQINLDIHPFD